MFRPSRAAVRSIVATLSKHTTTSTAAVAQPTLNSCMSSLSSMSSSIHCHPILSHGSSSVNNNISRYWFSSSTTDKEKSDGEQEESPTQEADAASSSAETEEKTQEEDGDDNTEESGKELEKELSMLKDQLLRALAEQENIRAIARNDVNASKQFAIKKFAKSLLEVADNLDRALLAVDAESIAEKAGEASAEFTSFYEGIVLTKDGLTKALESNGLKAFCETPGEAFDPQYHQALMEYADPSSEPGTVGQVIKKGYMLNGRVLRPAEVGVVKK